MSGQPGDGEQPDAWPVVPTPRDGAPRGLPADLTTGLLLVEVLIVLGVSLGRSGVYALVDLMADLTAGTPLASQSAVLNRSLAPGRPNLDLVLQLLRILFALVPVALVAYLLRRSAQSMATIGWDASQPARDVLRGAVLAAGVGAAGLALYLASYGLGLNLNVVAQALPDAWWRWSVLIGAAISNAVIEEVIVLGYLLHRLHQLGWGDRSAIACSAVVRGSYHLYQGFGGFLGNFAMGVVFGLLFRRWGRVMPMVVAHALIDIVAFIGYALLAGRVGWLP